MHAIVMTEVKMGDKDYILNQAKLIERHRKHMEKEEGRPVTETEAAEDWVKHRGGNASFAELFAKKHGDEEER